MKDTSFSRRDFIKAGIVSGVGLASIGLPSCSSKTVKAKPVHGRRSWRKISRNPTVRSGVSFGTALAIVLSYTKNASILWAIIHGILSWFYVVYRIILDSGIFA